MSESAPSAPPEIAVAPDAGALAPEALLSRMGEAALGPSAVEPLLEAAGEALADALAGRGERRGAYRLLAADACITWACEAALEGERPDATLTRVLEIVTRSVSEG